MSQPEINATNRTQEESPSHSIPFHVLTVEESVRSRPREPLPTEHGPRPSRLEPGGGGDHQRSEGDDQTPDRLLPGADGCGFSDVEPLGGDVVHLFTLRGPGPWQDVRA